LLSGGGTQPEKYVPADAIGFVKVDLDPAAGQKVAALRFFRHFPGGSDVLKGDDIREIFFRLLQENDNNLAQLDFDKDIAPWLGDRLGVAFLPPSGGGEQPEVLGVLQVKDEGKAKSGLAKVFDGDGPAVVFTDGYALLAADEASVTAARDEAAKGNLGDKNAFQDDLEPLGDGVAAFWLDLAAMKDAFGASLGAAAGQLRAAQADLLDETFKGRMAGAVTFNASHADLTVRGIGTSAFGVPEAGSKPIGPWLSTAPADTLVALGISGLDQVVADAFTSFLGIVQSEPAVGREVESHKVSQCGPKPIPRRRRRCWRSCKHSLNAPMRRSGSPGVRRAPISSWAFPRATCQPFSPVRGSPTRPSRRRCRISTPHRRRSGSTSTGSPGSSPTGRRTPSTKAPWTC
jgi:hypothetical protein